MAYELSGSGLLIPRTVATLQGELPQLAGAVITEYQDLSSPENRRFQMQPTAVEEHTPKWQLGWHEFDIVTHCIRSDEMYTDVLPGLLEEWGMLDQVYSRLEDKIDGVSRRELLRPTFLLHDIGKFAVRKPDDKRGGVTFAGHEVASGQIIRSDLVDERLEQAGLSPGHRAFFARGGELHYELGHVRKAAKADKDSAGYSIKFTQSDTFKAAVNKLIDKNPDFGVEIALLFLGDNLSKTQTRLDVHDDQELDSLKEQVWEYQAMLGRPELVPAVLQLPVNVAVGRESLRLALNRAA